MMFSALEQFQIFPLHCCRCSLAFTNLWIFLLIILVAFYFFFNSLLNSSSTKNSLLIIPTNWQAVLELVHKLVLSLVSENIKIKNSGKFLPLIITLFIFILAMNLIGLLPYSYTLTSQIAITSIISLSIFLGINIIAIKTHGLKFFALFLPSGTTILLAFLLVPIEIISYVFKPISLSIRLFANMMAGHSLLKVIAGFSSSMIFTGCTFLIVVSYIPILVLIPLFCLELAVAIIQAFVYAILICIYIQDSLSITH